jgi:hypothetical protein
VAVAVAVAVAVSRRRDRGMATSGSFTPIDPKRRLNHRGTEDTEPHRGVSDSSQEPSETSMLRGHDFSL